MRDVALCAFISSIPAIYWHSRVNSVVTEPYLDEVFHVRQAQAYCQGQLSQWDPKITTPPGLYLLSYLIYALTGTCDLFALRAINLFPGCAVLSYLILQKSRKENCGFKKRLTDASQKSFFGSTDYNDLHTAVNISLFPPLFFFTGLYYTDVLSVQIVLLHYLFSKERCHGAGFAIPILLVGLVALLFRQTNLFWVAVFHGALTTLQSLKDKSDRDSEKGESRSISLTAVVQRSFRDQTLYDLHVQDAQFEDFVKVAISIAIIAVIRMKSILYSATPYLMLCMLFVAYVVWNGGVVLGDKSNHVATLHIPQMLYIWPYTAFFSFPLLIPIISCFYLKVLSLKPLKIFNHYLPNTNRFRGFQLPRLKVYLVFIALSMITVHFNTIVHPFTLADNRHYIFYVFRILRWHPYVKYLAASTSIVCAHICILAMGCTTSRERTSKDKRTEEPGQGIKSMENTHCDNGQYVSFIIVWLTATALSVISAPLVEPRYFILPWIFWRLNVHSHGKPVVASEARPGNQKSDLDISVNRSGSLHLWIETGWYMVINAVTGYMFLYRVFEWAQEAGAVQRFMW